MVNREDIVYFGPGPAALPTAALEETSKAILNYESTGLGIAEHSHRSTLANKVLADTKVALKTLLDVPDSYEILFMQAGGTGEFSAVVYNLVAVWVERRRRKAEKELSGQGVSGADLEKRILERLKKETADELRCDYLVTGSWSLKASQEAARLIGPEYINVAVDARESNGGKFGKIPAEKTWAPTPTKSKGGKGSAFVYYCDNETVDGVEFPSFPQSLESLGGDEEDEPLVVADMSSNILSRKVDVGKFGLIFAGAQKNVGVTGITFVILRKSLLPPLTASAPASLLRALGLPPGPIIFDYPTIAKNNSLYNTLSILDVYTAGRVMEPMVNKFGEQKVAGMQAIADRKSKILYEALDKFPRVYSVVPDVSVRSRMNLCFRVYAGDAEKEKEWLKGAEEKGLTGLKGHRSVGGIRISNYNSVPEEGAEKLAKYIEDYGHQ
ncbi:MAG: Phosphoserine transaminase [Vezdaea aestivalis]|nr:MAG: Phosphoserine transaminase [Vezdaea aestivalis]